MAVALVLAVAIQASASGQAVQTEFGTPAQLSGDLSADGATWILLTFRDTNPTRLDLDMEAGNVARNYTVSRLFVDTEDGVHFDIPQQRAGDPWTLRQSHVQLGFAGWASLYVEADRISVTGQDAQARLGVADDADTPYWMFPTAAYDHTSHRPGAYSLATLGVGLAFAADDHHFPFDLQADGVRRIEWHNATVACWSGDCLPGGTTATVSPFPGAMAQELSYVQVAGNATLAGRGEALLVAAGGAGLDVQARGWLRLPQAELHGTCGRKACPDPDGRTLHLNGTVRLDGLHHVEADRLRADATGDLQFAAFDESAVPMERIGQVGVAAATAALMALAWLLFARRPPAQGLEHPRARTIYETIQSEPGLSFRDLCRRTGWSTQSVAHHLDKMLQARQVVARPHRNTLRYFEARAAAPDWKARVVLNDARMRNLHDWLLAHPRSRQSEVVGHAETAWGWTRAATRRRLGQLAEAQLLDGQRQGRTTIYTAERLV